MVPMVRKTPRGRRWHSGGMRLSVLDRANSLTGDSDATALRRVVEHARDVEKLGFSRFLVAEHHAVPGLPGSQPGMLAMACAAATDRIRIGTAGIMLPDHQPLIVAEQIATLEALHPARIDAGIGSSLGFTAPVRAALRQGDVATLKARYPDDLRELLSYLDGTGAVTARPQAGGTPVWLLAGFRSALLAAELGLGVILGGPNQVAAAQLYRENFRPGRIDAPSVILSANVAVAPTAEAARDLLRPEAWAKARARSTGSFNLLRGDLPVGPERRRMEETGLGPRTLGDVEKQLRGFSTPRSGGTPRHRRHERPRGRAESMLAGCQRMRCRLLAWKVGSSAA